MMAFGGALRNQAVDLVAQKASAFAPPHGSERLYVRGNEFH
jgi:hypothetical protein